MNNPFSMFWPTTVSSIGVMTLDVLVTENLKLPSEVTKYPVEDGNEDISDHITQNNEELSITGSVSSAKAFAIDFGPGCVSKLINVTGQLRQMHKARQPVTVVTGLGKYTDMAFTSLSLQRNAGDKGGNWLDINAELRKIKKVSLKTATLPEEKAAPAAKGKTGGSEKKAGQTDPNPAPPGGRSMAKSLQNYNNSNGGLFGIKAPVGPNASIGTPR
jgi:hypothetical protein